MNDFFCFHFPQFGGFSSESLAERMFDSKSSILITAGKDILLMLKKKKNLIFIMFFKILFETFLYILFQTVPGEGTKL